jgi:4-hydroxybenzoate polyprenyltransferase
LAALLKRWVDVFIFDNVFIACCAAAWSLATLAQCALPVQPDRTTAFVFFATLLVYNIHKSLTLIEGPVLAGAAALPWNRRLDAPLRFLLAASMAGTFVTFLLLSADEQVLVLVTGAVTAAYSFPLLRIRRTRKRIRELFVVKMLTISAVWCVATVWLPLVSAGPLPQEFLWLFAARLCFVFAITIPFEIRDMEQEKRWGNRTLPVALGIRKSKWLAYLLLGVFAAITLFQLWPPVSMPPLFAAACLLSGVAAGVLVRNTRETNSPFYYKFWVDGTMLFQAFLVILGYAFLS